MVVPMAATARMVALLAAALVAAGFVAFAADEARKGSDTQLRRVGHELGEPAPTAVAERERERAHGPARELLDDANDLLLSPFTGIVGSRDAWVQRTVPTGLALLVYGLGLGMVARSLPRRRPRAGGDWRVTAH